MRARGPSSQEWLVYFDALYDFVQTSERKDAANECRFLIHSKRGSLRAPVLAASLIIRRQRLRLHEALAPILAATANTGKSEMIDLDDMPTAAKVRFEFTTISFGHHHITKRSTLKFWNGCTTKLYGI